MLAGVFQQHWIYGVVGAAAIVLAAMYVLRLISGVLHRDVGSAVSEAALDLRPAELAIVVPLVAALLALSVWPAAISEHSFRRAGGCRRRSARHRPQVRRRRTRANARSRWTSPGRTAVKIPRADTSTG